MGRNGVAESPRPVPDRSEPTEAPAGEPPSPALPPPPTAVFHPPAPPIPASATPAGLAFLPAADVCLLGVFIIPCHSTFISLP